MGSAGADWDWFKAKVRDQAGLDLTLYREQQLDRRLRSMAERSGAANAVTFWRWLNAEPGRMRQFLDKLAINVSELFRNPERFAELERHFLPGLLAERPSLRVWSAGCSYGAEAYTMATILRDAAPTGRHSVVGTDIDREALDRAKAPKFSPQDMRHVPEARKRKHFEQDGDTFVPSQDLRSLVAFRFHDLLHDPFGSGYDLILCRNVVIYFGDEAKNTLYRRLYEALRPGGVLFVGPTERIPRSKEIGYETPMPFFYCRPAGGGIQWQRAS
jgi:chemotaxis protein methyltransferase CheR